MRTPLKLKPHFTQICTHQSSFISSKSIWRQISMISLVTSFKAFSSVQSNTPGCHPRSKYINDHIQHTEPSTYTHYLAFQHTFQLSLYNLQRRLCQVGIPVILHKDPNKNSLLESLKFNQLILLVPHKRPSAAEENLALENNNKTGFCSCGIFQDECILKARTRFLCLLFFIP